MPRLLFAVHEQQHSIVHEQVKNPLHQQNRWWSGFFACSATTCFAPEWMVVHERVFLGPPWTKLFAKSLFLLVHEQLYGIVHQHAFISRCWIPPNSLTDYLPSIHPSIHSLIHSPNHPSPVTTNFIQTSRFISFIHFAPTIHSTSTKHFTVATHLIRTTHFT